MSYESQSGVGTRGPALRRSSIVRILGLAAIAASPLIAAPAHAEAGSRICGTMVRASPPHAAVGFFWKVNKGDTKNCNLAISYANGSWQDVGGTGAKGANRVWRRVRGGSDGPLKNNLNLLSLNQTTCEYFTRYAADMGGDLCVGLSRNKTYVFAAYSGDFRKK
jgi:hypothetical protein